MNYLLMIRPAAGLFLAMMVIASFGLAKQDVHGSLLLAVTVFVLFAATCIWNDYCDRYRDALAEKTFALHHSRATLTFAIILWMIAISLVAILAAMSVLYLLMGLVWMVTGLAYQQTAKIAGLPALVVAFDCGICVLSPLHITASIIALAVFIFLTIFAREILKDLSDISQDFHPDFGKATLPVRIGIGRSMKVVQFLLAIAPIPLMVIAFREASLSCTMTLTAIGILIASISAKFGTSKAAQSTQRILDLVFAFMGISLSVF